MRFGAMLKRARERAGLSQAALAEKTGLPVRSVQNWEQGHRTPRVGVVLKLAQAVGVPVEELLLAMAGGEEGEAPAEAPPPEKPKRKGKGGAK